MPKAHQPLPKARGRQLRLVATPVPLCKKLRKAALEKRAIVLECLWQIVSNCVK